MSQDLGWSRTLLTGALALQSLGNMAVAPVIGIVLDRYGPRAIMVFGASVAAVCFGLMAWMTEPWQFYLLYTFATVLGLNELGNLVTSTTVAKWFVRLRGRALALGSIGLNFGAIIMAPGVAYLIGTVGWRPTWALLGVVVALTVVPASILFFRKTPEDMGLLPDGDTPGSDAHVNAQRTASREHQWKLGDALRNPTTWYLVIAFNLVGMAAGGLSQHSVAYLQDTGFSLVEATGLFALTHLITVGAKLLWGWMSDRVPVRYCLIMSNVARIVGLACLLLGTGPVRIYGWVIGSGMGQGLGLLQPKIWADYYGRTFLGTIRGVLHPFSVVAGVAGPLFAAYVYDSAGSYDLAFWTFVATVAASTVLVWFARPPVAPTAAR